MSDGTYIPRCFRCQAPNDAWGAIYCAACRQIDALEKQSNRAAELAEEQSAQFARQAEANARMQEEQHYESMRLAKQNAALAREQAKENARLAAESGVSYDDAYQYGLHYIDTAGTFELTVLLLQDGTIRVARTNQWNTILNDFYHFEPYKMAHLNQAFDRGLKESVKDVVGPGLDHMIAEVYNAGLNIEEEFIISSGVLVGKNEVVSRKFKSNITRTVDTDTGFVIYKWDHMFKITELNDSFHAGVSAIAAEENTDEKVRNRLETEVPLIIAEQARVAEEQRVAEENYRIQQEQQAAWNAKANAEREQQKNNRKIGVTVFLLVIVGFIVSLWMTDHGVLSFLAGFVAICGLFSGGIDALSSYIDGY